MVARARKGESALPEGKCRVSRDRGWGLGQSLVPPGLDDVRAFLAGVCGGGDRSRGPALKALPYLIEALPYLGPGLHEGRLRGDTT